MKTFSPGHRGRERADVQPELLDVEAVARLCDCSAPHVRRLADAGRMPAPVRVGALVRWNRRAIEVWIADGCPLTTKGGTR